MVASVEVLGVAVGKGDWSLAEACLIHGPPPSEQSIIDSIQTVFW